MSEKRKSKRAKCAKCGFENLVNASFCSRCGARLKPLPAKLKRRPEATFPLLLVGTAYLIVSLAVNSIYQVIVFAVPSIISITFGIYAIYGFYKEIFGRWVIASSTLAVIFGLAVTAAVFLTGLFAQGAFGPGWIIFAAAAWKLWKERKAYT